MNRAQSIVQRVRIALRLMAIACVVIGIAPPASADGVPQPANATEHTTDSAYCAPNAATDKYVGAEDMAALRAERSRGEAGAAFAGLSNEDKAVVTEALRIGPTGGVFSARLLRDMAILEAFEQQSACGQVNCPKPAIISHFMTGERGDPNAGKSWGDLIALWKGFRDEDVARARPCMQAARSKPDFIVAVASVLKGPPGAGDALVAGWHPQFRIRIRL